MPCTRAHVAPQRYAIRASRKAITRLLAAVTAWALGAGAVGLAQKVVSVDEFDRAMKTIGTAIESVNQSIGSRAYAEAKVPLALSRQILASTRPFWSSVASEPNAAKMARDGVAKLDALDKVLSAKTVDAAAVAAAFQDVTRACDACHAAYRQGDPQKGYRIKSVPR